MQDGRVFARLEYRSLWAACTISEYVSGATAFQVGGGLLAPSSASRSLHLPHKCPRWRMMARIPPRKKRPRADPRAISDAITRSARVGDVAGLDATVRAARRSNVALNAVNYTALAAGLARGRKFRRCFEALASMRALNLKPTNATLRVATAACLSWVANEGTSRASATLALQEMVKWFADAGESRAEIRSWNMAIAAFGKLGARRRMSDVLRVMEEHGGIAKNVPKPDIISYNTCMAVMKGNMLQALLLFAGLIRGNDAKPDVASYNALLKIAMDDVRYLVGLAELEGTMKERVVKGSVLYIKAVRKSMKRQNIEPDLITWTGMLRLLTRTQAETKEVANLVKRAVFEVWLDLGNSNRPSTPDLILYNALISAFAQVGDPHAAAKVLLDMQAHGVSADMCTLNSILAVLSRKGEVDAVVQTLGQLRGLSAEIDTYTYIAALSACSRCTPTRPQVAEMLLEDAIRDGVKWRPAMVNAAISSFGDCITDALQFWQKLRSTAPGNCMNAVKHVQAYEALFRVCGRAGRPDVALRIIYVMRKSRDVKASSGANLFHSFERGVREGDKEHKINGLLARTYLEHFRTECRAFTMDLPVERIRIKY